MINPETNISPILDQSEHLADDIEAIFRPVPPIHHPRHLASSVACSLALEHWEAAKILFSAQLLPSAITVHRSQFEALVRSIWLLHAASETEVNRLASDLTKESEQAAKNIAGLQEMISEIGKKGPAEAFNALARFRDNALKPMNSYVHTGVHSLSRHASGYPIKLIIDVLRNSNGIALMTWMHASILVGRPDFQRTILEIAKRYPACLPAQT
jgi:hypothetical protein